MQVEAWCCLILNEAELRPVAWLWRQSDDEGSTAEGTEGTMAEQVHIDFWSWFIASLQSPR